MQYTEIIYRVPLFNRVLSDNATPETAKNYHELYTKIALFDYKPYFQNYWGVDAIALYVQKLQLVGDTRKTISFITKLLRALYYANPVKDVYEEMISKFGVVLQELTTDDLDCFYTKLNNFIVNDLAKHLYF